MRTLLAIFLGWVLLSAVAGAVWARIGSVLKRRHGRLLEAAREDGTR